MGPLKPLKPFPIHLKCGPGAAPGRAGDALGGPGPVVEVLDLSWKSWSCILVGRPEEPVCEALDISHGF